MSAVRGTDDLRRRLRMAGPEYTKGIREVMADSAQVVLHEMQARVPAQTGKLRSLLSAKVAGDGLAAQIGLRGKKANRQGFYALYQEFGTVKQPAQPFMVPALEATAPEIMRRLAKAINAATARLRSR